MDWYTVDRGLAPRFDGAPRQAGAGFWIPAKEPIPLGPFLDEGLSEDEREEYEGSFDAWPAHVEMVLDASEAQVDSVLSCFWSSMPGLSSADRLDLIGTKERSYLCFWSDWGEGHRAIACLQPGSNSDVTDDLLEQVFVSNGNEFGVSLWGSPPSEFSASVPESVLERAFDAMRAQDEYGEWDEFFAEGSWRLEGR